MNLSNESKLKGFLTRLFKKKDKGKPFAISFQGEKTYISQDRIDSIKGEKQGGFPFTFNWKSNIIHKRWEQALKQKKVVYFL